MVTISAFLWEAPSSNAFQTTLNGTIGAGDVSINLNSVTGLTSPGVLVLDRQDGNGNNTPTAREYVTFTGISGTQITGVTRGVAGSTAQSHSSGGLVEGVVSVTHWGEMIDFLQVEHDSAGKHVISTATIAYGENIRLAVTSIASIAQMHLTRGIFSTVTITTLLNAANASIVGTFGGATNSGHFLWIQSNALVTSLATSTNSSQIPFLRATKDLTINSVYIGLNSAPSLAPLQIDVYYKSTPTGVTGTSIFSVRPLVGVGLNENTSGPTIGTLSLTSLASGTLLYPEIRQPGAAGDMTLQLVATNR